MISLTVGSDQYNLYGEYYSYYVWKENHCVFGKAYTDGCWVTKRKRLTADIAKKKSQAVDLAVKVSGLAMEEAQELIHGIDIRNMTITINSKMVTFSVNGRLCTFNYGKDKENAQLRSSLIKEGIIKDSLKPSAAYIAWERFHHNSVRDINLPARQAIFASGAVGSELEVMVHEARKDPKSQGKAYKKRLRAEAKERREEEEEAKADALELALDLPAENQVILTVRDAAQQADFKNRLAKNYHLECCISGAPLIACEAAHLKPFAEDGGYELSNGLLLRADIHTLFDRGHVGIDPADSWYVYFSPEVREHYAMFEGYMRLGNVLPDWDIMMAKWKTFKERWGFSCW